MLPIDESIGRVARRQRGYVTRAQLVELGLGPEAIRSRITMRRLIIVHRGVYAVGHAPQASSTVPMRRSLPVAAGQSSATGPPRPCGACLDRWWEPFEVIVDTARRRPGIRIHRVTLTARTSGATWGSA